MTLQYQDVLVRAPSCVLGLTRCALWTLWSCVCRGWRLFDPRRLLLSHTVMCMTCAWYVHAKCHTAMCMICRDRGRDSKTNHQQTGWPTDQQSYPLTYTHYIAWHDMTWDEMTWYEMILYDMTWHDMRWHYNKSNNMTLHYITLYNIACRNITFHNIT